MKKLDNKKIVIIGADGYIGSNLKAYFESKGQEVYSLVKGESKREKMRSVDITNFKSVYSAIQEIKPGIVIHVAGMSSLAECEKNKKLAFEVNVQGTRNIIESIKKINSNITLIFLSSDYVFDGQRGSYREDDKKKPATYYGQTKVQSEEDIKKNLKNYIICRTANVYGRGGNFFNFLHESLMQEKSIDVFDDVYYTPTYIDYLTDCIFRLLEMGFNGVIHVVGKEKVSRYDFASVMADALGKDKNLVLATKQATEGLIAKDSSLNSTFAQGYLKNFCPNIEKSLQYCLGSLIYPYFYFEDDRGKILGLFQDMNWEEINYIESLKNQIRGNHYHKETREAFFIIEGKIKVRLENLSGNQPKKEFIVEKGDVFFIDYNILHTFEIIEDSKWINMLSKSMKVDNKDIHKRV